jgi:uncharacterized protein YeaO (DUF488 family)
MSAKISPANIMLKRAYERPDPHDGVRILVDRLWPRGVTKQAAAIDQWFKEIAPTAELRKWFGHEAQRWPEFQRRYAQELAKHEPLLETLREHARRGPLTLVYSAHDELHNDAIVLRNVLLGN